MDIFYTSPWLPPEWIKAHGLHPRGIWFAPELTFERLTQRAGACAFANAATRLASTDGENLFIFTTHCDQLRRSFDALLPQTTRGHAFLFNLPATWQTAVSQQLYFSELERLSRFLIAGGGKAPDPRELFAIMEDYKSKRNQLANARERCSALSFASAIADFFSDYALNLAPAGTNRPDCLPLAIVGGPLLPSQRHLLDLLEQTGARIVLNATEPGERHLWTSPPLSASLPQTVPALLEALAHEYFLNCAEMYQRPNTKLYSWLEARLNERKFKGLVLWHHAGCDLWRAEADSLHEHLRIPVLLLDADELKSGSLRTMTRLEAFVEALR